MSVTSVKDDIAGKRGERRTQTFKDQDNTPMIPGATFVPNSTDQYTSGRWVTAVSSTQTLPALHIDTEGGVRITSIVIRPPSISMRIWTALFLPVKSQICLLVGHVVSLLVTSLRPRPDEVTA